MPSSDRSAIGASGAVNPALLRTDGGARGNPGPAGAGFVIESDGRVLCEAGRYLGETTNNVAEYEALIWGLENALALDISDISILSDSELLVRQLSGVYRVKSPQLKPLVRRAKELLGRFAHTRIEHVLRAENAHADELANAAMDTRGIVGDPACVPPEDISTQESLF
jgi:ribonuclease HI